MSVDAIEQRIVAAITARYAIGKPETLKASFDQIVRPIELPVTSAAEPAVTLSVPLGVEIGTGPNWGAAH